MGRYAPNSPQLIAHMRNIEKYRYSAENKERMQRSAAIRNRRTPDNTLICKATRKGKPCGAFAIRGCKYCRHCGAIANRPRYASFSKCDMPAEKRRFYSKRVGPRLYEFIGQCIAAPDSEQTSLLEELAISRDVLGQILEMGALVEKLPNNTVEQQAKRNAMSAQVAEMMRGSLNDVRVMAESAARIRSMAKDNISPQMLNGIMEQIVKCVYLCFDDNTKGLLKFERLLAQEVSVPKSAERGTHITPDMDILEMDLSVPRSPDQQGLTAYDVIEAANTVDALQESEITDHYVETIYW